VTILEPFFVLASQTSSNVTFKRIQSALLTPLLSSLTEACCLRHEESSELPPKRRKLSSDAAEATADRSSLPEEFPLRHVVMRCIVNSSDKIPSSPPVIKSAMVRSLFEVASRGATRDSNRRKMYAICKDARDEEDEED
jgi:ribosomal RNA-processing protein 1